MRLLQGSLVALFVLGCGGGVSADPCAGGPAYPDEAFATNASAELAMADQLLAMNALVKDVNARPTAAQLQSMYEAGTPSLSSIAAPAVTASLPALFASIESSAAGTWTPAEPPPATGGRLGGVLFSARGQDLQEALEKGLLAGAHYHEALRLLEGEVTPATVDRILALYGAWPSFPMDTKAAVNPDRFSAGYAKRRTNPAAETPGLYLTIKQAFIDARAAAAGGATCAAKRDAALEVIRSGWERAMVGTTVYYLNSAAGKLEKSNPTDAERASGLHAYNEAVGFLKGLRALPASSRRGSDAQLDEVLATLLAPSGAEVESYKFLTDGVTNLPRLVQAGAQLQAAWAFTADEVANFKVNY